ncbi:MAG: ACT domain-containing protein, partial [Pygmaiobacter sp.]
VALAAKLGWDCEIYTDVEGIYTADPRLCPRAKKLAHIRCDEMMEMSSLGAGVLETRSVELAKKYGVRLFLGKALEADHTKGTYIMDTMTFEEMPVTGLSIKDDCSLIQARGRGAGGALTCELFALLAQLDINVDMISQQMESAEVCTLSFSCCAADADLLLRENAKHPLSYALSAQHHLTKLSLIGAGMITHCGIAGKAFAVLQRAGVPYYQITTSEISISLTIHDTDKETAISALCAAFDLCNEEEN